MSLNRILGLVFSGFAVRAAAVVLALYTANVAADFVSSAFAKVDTGLASKL